MNLKFGSRVSKKIGLALLTAQIALFGLFAFTPVESAQAATAVNPDLAYLNVWERTDYPVALSSAQRSWYWGPAPFALGNESYTEASGGSRKVQYWDKSRMEITNPAANSSNKYYVTNGLLVRELVTGKVQVGDNGYLNRSPSEVPVSGDTAEFNPDSPTYASFKDVVSLALDKRANRASGAISTTINKAGTVGTNSALASRYPETAIAYYEDKLGHNIPGPMWRFMNASGSVVVNHRLVNQVIEDWVFAFGLPISEAYWTRSRVAGQEKDVLVQLFERRILTYTPSNPTAYQVEMGNVGRHYYSWRYGSGGTGVSTAPAYTAPITRLKIPTINVDAPIEYVVTNQQGLMDVPNGPNDVAWYKPGARVGERGNAVITGHLDYYTQGPAIFWNLNKLKVGDTVEVTNTIGTKFTFRVTEMTVYPASAVPTDRIFAESSTPNLNIITCNGAFIQGRADYTDRLVVYTTLVS